MDTKVREKQVTCIICPIGCVVVVRGDQDKLISVGGHECKRGEEYAYAEFNHPTRILTSTIKVDGAREPLVAVRSSAPLPKEMLFDCMAEIKKTRLNAPVHQYDCLIPDILGTGVNIIATANAYQAASICSD